MVRKKRKIMTTDPFARYRLCAIAVVILTVVAGCAENYGSYHRDEQVQQAFENNQLSTDYKYFYNGQHNMIYAILGIDPKYILDSKFWRRVEPNTEEFRQLRSRIWEDYNRYTYGADLLDPAGNRVGVFYSSIYGVSIKFYENNHIEVMLNTPFLWGPDDHGGGGMRTPE